MQVAIPTSFIHISGMSRDPSIAKPKAVPSEGVDLVDIEVAINFDLIERRKSVRPIPVAEAVERDDEESWSTWMELTAQQDLEVKSKSAIAKLRQLLRQKNA